MKFCDNLIYLRKKKHMSQEQLALELGVTRQSVSKWESGNTYPEMDKLSAMCKLFDVSLDTLVNKDVSKAVDNSSSKNIIEDFFKRLEDYTSKTLKLFSEMSSEEVFTFIITIIVMIFCILLLKVPFVFIENSIIKIFTITNTEVGMIFATLCSFLFNLIYIILAFTIFFIVFKLKFLDENKKSNIVGDSINIDEHSKKETTNETTNAKKNSSPVIGNREKTVVGLLTKIILILVKIFIFCIIFIPIVFCTLISMFTFAILIILIAKGLLLLGPIIFTLACTMFGIALIILLFNFFVNRSSKFTPIIITILSSFFLGSVGVGLTVWYFADLTYYNYAPEKLETYATTKTIDMQDNLMVDEYFFNKTEFVVDESLTDKVIIKGETIIPKPSIVIENVGSYRHIDFDSDLNSINVSKFIKQFIHDLKNKQVYTYNSIDSFKTTITTSSQNIEKIKQNAYDYNFFDD